MGGHRSADEVVGHLHSTGRPLARASVYNSLEAMAAADLILRADAGPGAAIYEVNPGWHHHFVCRRCGLVVDVPCVRETRPCLEPDPALGLVVDEAQIIFRGFCPQCANQPG